MNRLRKVVLFSQERLPQEYLLPITLSVTRPRAREPDRWVALWAGRSIGWRRKPFIQWRSM